MRAANPLDHFFLVSFNEEVIFVQARYQPVQGIGDRDVYQGQADVDLNLFTWFHLRTVELFRGLYGALRLAKYSSHNRSAHNNSDHA